MDRYEQAGARFDYLRRVEQQILVETGPVI
jgi:hypothetical protein